MCNTQKNVQRCKRIFRGRANTLLGKEGEAIALEFFIKQGYSLNKQNYRNKVAEIDIICENDTEILFCEVKTSSIKDYDLFEKINRQKILKMKKRSLEFLHENTTNKLPRLVLVVVSVDKNTPSSVVELYDLLCF